MAESVKSFTRENAIASFDHQRATAQSPKRFRPAFRDIQVACTYVGKDWRGLRARCRSCQQCGKLCLFGSQFGSRYDQRTPSSDDNPYSPLSVR